jgi:hypothetical protein
MISGIRVGSRSVSVSTRREQFASEQAFMWRLQDLRQPLLVSLVGVVLAPLPSTHRRDEALKLWRAFPAGFGVLT